MNEKPNLQRILVIQNAFIGDAILATAVLEKLHTYYPSASISFLVRKDAAGLFENHPFINELMIFDRKSGKWKELFRLSKIIRSSKFSAVITLQRFGSSGFLTWRSAAKIKCGFSSNPFSFCFTNKVKHELDKGYHEIYRNQQVIATLTDETPVMPKLYPQTNHDHEIQSYKNNSYITISPASVWFTKQWPTEKWIELISRLSTGTNVYLLGGKADELLCEKIALASSNIKVVNLAGKLSFLGSAALMKGAKMNFTNDSAPLHMCGAVGAKLSAVFCSTVTEFGFGPVLNDSKVIETKEKLDCRPCGIHGHKKCPKGHFKCALAIDVNKISMDFN